MTQLTESVKSKLKISGADKDTIALCEKIINWYEEGGSDFVELNINNIIEEVAPSASKKRKKK